MTAKNSLKPNIKIFVSHRTDQVSETIDNPLYANVRCGAVYDKENKSGLIGDDTGDNISAKKYQYSELTVQYWAWKNVKADYYGLCHYRRYLDFTDGKQSKYKRNEYDFIISDYLDRDSQKEFGLLNAESMIQIINQYDAIVGKKIDIRNVNTPSGYKNDIFSHWKAVENIFIPKDTVELLLSVVYETFPQYYDDAVTYLHGWEYYGFNLYILKKELFHNLCEFQFTCLFQLERRLDPTYFPETMSRTCGFMAEILYGIFIFHLEKGRRHKIKNADVVYFVHTNRKKELCPISTKNNIPLVLVSSEFYIPYVAVCLQSLIDHASDSMYYDIIIFHREISADSQHVLERMVEQKKNISVRFYDVGFWGEGEEKANFSVEAYYRLLTPWILKKYNKVIVMDADIILNEDIAKLFYIDVNDVSIAAVQDIVYKGYLNGFAPGTMEYARCKMKLENPYDYVNTGVLLMNLSKIRRDHTETEIVHFYNEHHFNIQGRDCLNAIYQGDVKFLDLKWNYCVEVNPTISAALNFAPRKEKERYYQIDPYFEDKAPYVIHYASQLKPWADVNVKYAEFFWNNAKKTEFYHLILFRMMQGIVAKQEVVTCIPQASFARRAADKFFPIGSRRRDVLKKVIPRGSPQWNFLKKVYHKFTF